MPEFPLQSIQRLSTAGGAVTIDITSPFTEYIFNGVGSLLSDYVIIPSATPTKPCSIRIFYNCQFLLNGSVFTVFSKALTLQQALEGNILIEATYDLVAAEWVVVIKQSDANLIPVTEGVNTRVLTAASGTITLIPGVDNEWQELQGTDTLAAGIVVTALLTPGKFYIHYTGTMPPNGQPITFFGQALTPDQIANGGVFVIAYFDVDSNVWRAHLTQDPKKQAYDASFIVPVSFETGEQCDNSVIAPFNGNITKIYESVTKLIEATNDANLQVKIAGGNVTGGAIVIPAGSILNYNSTVIPSAAYSFLKGQQIEVTGSKATAGGKSLVTLLLTRTP